MVNIDLSGKNAIITGGSSGIGKTITLALADSGANVWIGDLNEQGADIVCKEVSANGGNAGFTKTNVSKPEEVAAMFDGAKKAFGKVDIVVNSAGLFLPGKLLDVSPEQIKAHLDVNVFGVIYSTRCALEIMIEQGLGGKILNIASAGGRMGEVESPYYSLGKSCIINFTQSAAFTGAPHKINVNALCPGMVLTPMWEVILDDAAGGDDTLDREELFQGMVKRRSPLGRGILTDEVAWAACFLCSNYADAIVGQALNVCGGWRMN